MISICIPIFNFDVRKTVTSLIRQAEALSINYEINLVDDFSEASFRELNREISAHEHVNYKELGENIGRSKIRNLLARNSKYDRILFLDCDSLIHKKDFVETYVKAIKEGHKVICGGRLYPDNKPDKKKLLRWKYGHAMESKPYNVRNINPSKSFMTNNFVIDKQIFDSILFDEKISKYGHEDTLFGYELSKQDIVPFHIDNPIMNGDIEDFELFMEKTRNGIENLIYFKQNYINELELISSITLLAYYNKIDDKPFMKFVISSLESPLLILLKKGITHPKLFNLYKLCYLVKKMVQRPI